MTCDEEDRDQLLDMISRATHLAVTEHRRRTKQVGALTGALQEILDHFTVLTNVVTDQPTGYTLRHPGKIDTADMERWQALLTEHGDRNDTP